VSVVNTPQVGNAHVFSSQTNNTEVQIPFFATSLTPGKLRTLAMYYMRLISSIGTPLDWNYTTTPQTGLAGRSIPFARGFALGGSSAVSECTRTR
jgi:choline dehydrogenase-like flavoprotein